ncbi:hypothetical protein NDU88_004618 [Pleurodeles waltl]|uniref:Reverse transcriptase RNase H-like domain-containing protein n=1 Tax=Pleurodeles waltl TaxID=8319 RepID=A0AAV7NK68_PLEWA|nr:hypothetical protein NDU88_004618 [Pleurodeles waltl]
MSRKLNEAEKNYVIAEKELLAIRDAFKEWRHHLLGAKYTVTVYTDHRNLQFMSSARLLTPRQLRWMLFFAEFDFVVTFRPGKDNRKADALSRQESTTLPAVQTSRAIIAPDKVLCIIKTEDFFEDIRNSFTVEKWQAWAQADPKRSIKQGLPFYDARFMATLDELVKAITQLQSEVVSSKDLTNSLAERVSQLQNKVEKKEQSLTANFNRLVAETSWPEEKQAALFYRGLKEELKDILARVDPQPANCQDLINLVLRLDHRLNERKGTRKKTEKHSWHAHDNKDSRTPRERTPEPMEIGTIRRPLTKD